jgi:RNA polymerase sigma-70 factor, ECF subfamily
MINKMFSSARKTADGETRRLSDVELFSMLKEEKGVAEKAFRELYSRHSARIYAYCRCVFSDEEPAKDVFQDAFMRFYESAKSGREVKNVPAYLLIITRNLCLNAKRSKRDTVNLEDFHLSQSDDGQDKSELLQLIKTAMELLPDDHREAFTLREFEDLPYDEIAVIQDTSVVNARVRVMRARQRIREILKPYLVELSQ